MRYMLGVVVSVGRLCLELHTGSFPCASEDINRRSHIALKIAPTVLG